MRAVRVVLAAPPAPDAGTRRDAGDFLHEPATSSAGSAPANAPRGASTAVVIDVLRATTSLSVAMSNGAARVLPAATVDEALGLRSSHPGALLCGEREGRPIPGFDLGNSPLEYARAVVEGRTLIFASTNGSQALRLAAAARRRLLGSFANAAAVVERASSAGEVWLVAAGKLGRFSLEDAACAGWILRGLAARGFRPEGAPARLAEALAPRDAGEVRAILEGCSHGRYLRSLGGAFARDVEFCARVDRLAEAFEV